MTETTGITSVDDLLKVPFRQRSLTERRSIIKNGKPSPELPNLTLVHKEKSREYTRHFSTNLYESSEWLTGCDIRSKVFCWPCVLFANDSGVWSTKGFDDLRSLTKAIKRHEQTSNHVQHHLSLRLFDKQDQIDMTSQQLMVRISIHNETVKKNLATMKRLLEYVCFTPEQEMSPRQQIENRLNLECFESFRMFDSKTSTYIEGISPSIVNEMIEAVNTVIRNYIKEQIRAADFVSFILDENGDVSNESQLSTILRYVYHGQTYERFIGFTDVSVDRTADALLRHVLEFASEYDIENKLFGQTYDGACVSSDQLYQLQIKVRDVFPRALFVPCYAHDLNLILQQSLDDNQKCRTFFKTLKGISTFFSRSSKRRAALTLFVSQKLHGVVDTQWCFTSGIVQTVNDQLKHLYDFFTFVMNDADGRWDSDSVIKARAFRSFLNEFETVLFFEIFARIFSLTGGLHDLVQACSNETTLVCQNKFLNIKEQLMENKFSAHWDSAIQKFTSIDIDSKPDEPKRMRIEIYDKDSLQRMYFDILDTVYKQIGIRFQHFKRLEFRYLLCYSNYPEYHHLFPQAILNDVIAISGPTFDYFKLKSELTVLYMSHEFANKSISELVGFMHHNDVNSVFPETYKLATLVLSLPTAPPSTEKFSSALERIRSFIQKRQKDDRLSNLDMISIERDVLVRLREKEILFDKVIHEFKKNNQTMELNFK